jgi:outer membrane protein assembly factor BamB
MFSKITRKGISYQTVNERNNAKMFPEMLVVKGEKMMRQYMMISFLSTFFALATLNADNVGWRRDGSGKFQQVTPPTEWSASKNIVWKTPLPSWSNASPIIVGKRIFICAEPDILLCLSSENGRILWEKKNSYNTVLPSMSGKSFPKTHGVDGYSSPTPVSDGKYVCAMFGMGILVCYDMKGKLQWAKHFETPNQHKWGYCSTPLLYDGKLILHMKDVVALDIKTGKQLWKTASLSPKWGSPVAFQIGKAKAVVTAAGEVIYISNGKLIHKIFRGLTYNAPIVNGDTVYMIQNGGQAYKITKNSSKRLWSTKPAKDRYYASPIYHEGIIYAVTQKGVFSAIDADSGEVIYSEKLKIGRTVYPSIVLAGDLLFVSSDNGKTAVLKTGRKFQQLSLNSLEKFRCSPWFQGKHLYIRGMKHMYCIGK